MKKDLRNISVAVVVSVILCGQVYAQQFSWAVGYGTAGNVHPGAIALDSRSNVYNAGAFYDNPDMDPAAGTYTLYSMGDQDAYIQKLGPSGHFAWAKHLGSIYREAFTLCETDADDNIYLAGYFNDTLDFDPGPFVHYAFGNKASNMFVLKLDNNGDFAWVYTLSAGNMSSIKDLEVNAQGIYLGGNFTDTLFAQDTLISNGSNDGFVMKLDPNGTPQWMQRFGNTGGDYLLEIESDAAGNLFMMGVFNGTVDLDFGPGTFTVEGTADMSVFLLKTDASGNFLHAVSCKTDMPFVGYSSLEIDRAGNVIMSHNFSSMVDFDPGPGYFNVYGHNDIFILKLSNALEFEWVKVIDGTGQLYVMDIAIDDNNSIFLIGEHNNSADYDPGPDTLSFPGTSGVYVSFLEKLDRNGNFLWVQTEDVNHRYIDIFAVANGEVYANGTYKQSFDADPSEEEYILPGALSAFSGFAFKWSDPSVGVEDQEDRLNYAVYPNPTNGNVTLDLGNVSGTYDVSISNITGKIISKQTFTSTGKVAIRIDGPAGFYLLTVASGKKHAVTKLVKE